MKNGQNIEPLWQLWIQAMFSKEEKRFLEWVIVIALMFSVAILSTPNISTI